MKILFICPGGDSFHSQIASCILSSFNQDLDVYAVGLIQADPFPQELLEVMDKSDLVMNTPQYTIEECPQEQFDYLISLCDSVHGALQKQTISSQRHLHLSFTDFRKNSLEQTDLKKNYQELVDEIKTELHYFYHHILLKASSN